MWGTIVLTGSSATWTTRTDEPSGFEPRCRNGLFFVWNELSVLRLCRLETRGEFGRLLGEIIVCAQSPALPTGIGLVTATPLNRSVPIPRGFGFRPTAFLSDLGSWVFLCDLSWLACVNVLSQCWHLYGFSPVCRRTCWFRWLAWGWDRTIFHHKFYVILCSSMKLVLLQFQYSV